MLKKPILYLVAGIKQLEIRTVTPDILSWPLTHAGGIEEMADPHHPNLNSSKKKKEENFK